MERKKKVIFCLTVTSTALDKGKGMQVRANNRAVRCQGETAAGHCSKPVCLATSSDVLTKIISKIMTSPWCHKAQHSALVKPSNENTRDALEPRKRVIRGCLSFFVLGLKL